MEPRRARGGSARMSPVPPPHFQPLLTQLLLGPISLISALISSTLALFPLLINGKRVENNTWDFYPGAQRRFLLARAAPGSPGLGFLLARSCS